MNPGGEAGGLGEAQKDDWVFDLANLVGPSFALVLMGVWEGRREAFCRGVY